MCAMKTQGTELYVVDPADNSVIDVGCVVSIDGIDSAVDTVETTCLSDDARTYLGGIATPGVATFEINTDPADPSHIRLHQLKTSGQTLQWAIGWSDGTSVPTAPAGDMIPGEDRSWLMFEGYMSSFGFNFVENDVVSSTIGIQISGEVALLPFYQLTPIDVLAGFFAGGRNGFLGSVDPQDEMAYTTATGNTLATNPGDPVGRVESLAGGLTLSQPISAARPVLGRYPEGGIRNRVLTTDTTGFVPGAPGEIPSNWRLVISPGGSGVGREIIGTGVEDGIPYVDVRFFGTSTASASCQVGTLGGVNGQFVPSAAGDTWTNSFYVTLLTGSVAEFSQLSATIYGRNAGSGFEEGFTNAISITSGTLGNARKIGTSTLSDVDSAGANGLLVMDFDSGQTIDVTIRVGGFQFERGAIATPLQFVHGAPYDITEPGKREIWSIYGNGTQWMTFGTDQFGTATLFAGAGQEWVSVPSFATFSGDGMAIVCAETSSSPDQKFWQGLGITTPFVPRTVLRGLTTSGPWGDPAVGGMPYIYTLRWDGAAITGWQPVGGTEFSPAVGTLADNAANITFMARREDGPLNIYTGFAMPFLLDSAPSDPEMTTLRTALMEEAGA